MAAAASVAAYQRKSSIVYHMVVTTSGDAGACADDGDIGDGGVMGAASNKREK